MSALRFGQIAVYKAVLTFLLLVPLSSWISPMGLEVIKLT